MIHAFTEQSGCPGSTGWGGKKQQLLCITNERGCCLLDQWGSSGDGEKSLNSRHEDRICDRLYCGTEGIGRDRGLQRS